MDYDEINNCMSDQQKTSLMTAALQTMVENTSGAAQEYTNYDDVNNHLTEQQKLSLMASALTYLKENGGGEGGVIVPFEDYVDISTFTITDKDGLIGAINEGKGFYSNGRIAPTGEVTGVLFYGAVTDDKIVLTSSPAYAIIGGTNYSLEQMTLNFDKNTGALDPTNPAFRTEFFFPHVDTSDPMSKTLGLGKLTFAIGSTTYEYDGSQDINITIADGENMGF